MFADTARIIIRSGKGGDGHVSFRREKYVPDGGPDGGDGGRGGDVIFLVDSALNTLVNFRHKRKFQAQDGFEGGKSRCHGKSGQDLIIRVPKGTIIKEAESGLIIHDMGNDTEPYVILKGGKGGLGNQHFATSVMQAPKYAQPGGPAKELEVILELKVIADVGLVGFPNVGKSTLLSVISNAKPKIANYHFTTLEPNLGVVDLEDGEGFVVADIPGIIEGASEGAGLGHEFLKHIERCRILIHVVDAAGVEDTDPVSDIRAINAELSKYSDILSGKAKMIAANKIDAFSSKEERDEVINILKAEFEPEGFEVFEVSGLTREGIKPLLYRVNERLKELPGQIQTFADEYDLEDYHARAEDKEPVITEKLDESTYLVEGSKVEKMLGYTNLESEKGFMFFQDFMEQQGIISRLKELGLKEGDTVKVFGHEFEYYE